MAAFRRLDGPDVAVANVQDSGDAFRPIAVAIGTLGGCGIGAHIGVVFVWEEGVWAAKRHVSPHVSPAYEETCAHKKLVVGSRNRNRGRCRHFDTFTDAPSGSPSSRVL